MIYCILAIVLAIAFGFLLFNLGAAMNNKETEEVIEKHLIETANKERR